MEIDPQAWRAMSEAALPVMLGTMAMTAALILLLFPLLRRYALARPNARSSHTIPTPQGGGIAVIATTVVALLGAAFSIGGDALAGNPHLLAVIAATVGLAVLGMTDDIRPMAAGLRLVFQALAVGLVVATLPADLQVVPALPFVAERAALALGLLWFVNLVNFMDGIDWMSVAEIVPVTAASPFSPGSARCRRSAASPRSRCAGRCWASPRSTGRSRGSSWAMWEACRSAC